MKAHFFKEALRDTKRKTNVIRKRCYWTSSIETEKTSGTAGNGGDASAGRGKRRYSWRLNKGKTTTNERSDDLSGGDYDEHRLFCTAILFYFFCAYSKAEKIAHFGQFVVFYPILS